MIVREIVREAVLSLNLNSRDPRVIERAVNIFNRVMKHYSGNNTMTAYQSTLDFTPSAESTTIGAYRLKSGYNDLGAFNDTDHLPDPSSAGETDVCYSAGSFMQVGRVRGLLSWVAVLDETQVADFVPDVVRPNVIDCVNIVVKVDGQWRKVDRINYADFFTARNCGYAYRPIGENKLEVLVKPDVVGRECRMVYSTAMNFREDDFVELPELYQPLILAAVICQLGLAFPAVDSAIVDGYNRQLEKLEGDVMSRNIDERGIVKCSDAVQGGDPFKINLLG